MVQDRVIGLITAQSYSDPDYFIKKDLDILIAVSSQIAIAIERKQGRKIQAADRDNVGWILAAWK